MKSLFSVFITLLIAFNMNAQIDVIKYEIEDIANLSNCGRLSRGGDKLILNKDKYALCLYTSNQFDDPIVVFMGDLEEATATFKDIQDKWYSMNKGDYFYIGDTKFMMVDETKSSKLLHVTDKESAGFGALYLKSIQACYMVLRNISINTSKKSTDGSSSEIASAPKQEHLEESGTTASKIETKQKEDKVDNNSFSIADELLKLNELKEKGVLTEEEFQKLKSQLLKRI